MCGRCHAKWKECCVNVKCIQIVMRMLVLFSLRPLALKLGCKLRFFLNILLKHSKEEEKNIYIHINGWLGEFSQTKYTCITSTQIK